MKNARIFDSGVSFWLIAIENGVIMGSIYKNSAQSDREEPL